MGTGADGNIDMGVHLSVTIGGRHMEARVEMLVQTWVPTLVQTPGLL